MSAADFVLAAGLFDLALAAFHVTFWKLFDWPEQLKPLDPINRGILQVANLALICLFALLGIALMFAPPEASRTAFGQILLGGLSLFWLARAAVQAPYFGLKHPVSILLTLVFLLGAALHALPLFVR
jgi:hypothetical protein